MMNENEKEDNAQTEPQVARHMNKNLVIWLTVFVTLIGVWFYSELGGTEINYEIYAHLVDPASGLKRKPAELIDLNKVIKPTPDYINSTNAEERLYDLEYQLHLANIQIIDQSYSKAKDLLQSGLPVADQRKCGEQMNWILQKLNQYKRNYTLLRGQLGYELTSYMDTFGRPQAGIYKGLVDWSGSYRFCLQSHLDGGQLKTGRYCFARFRLKTWPPHELASPATSIRIGVCLPETCDTLSLKGFNSSIEELVKFNLPDYYKESLEFRSMFCLPDERSPIRQWKTSSYIFLCVVMGWISLVLVCTIWHESMIIKKNKKIANNQIDQSCDELELKPSCLISYKVDNVISRGKNKDSTEEFLELMSLRSSFKSFLTNKFNVNKQNNVSVAKARVNLSPMDFIRVFMTFLIIFVHIYFEGLHYIRLHQVQVDLTTSRVGKLVISMVRCVDIFFIFFGILTSYTLMGKYKSSNQLLSNMRPWLSFNLNIFLKVTPIYMLIYWYTKSISPYTSSGPWWDYGVDKSSWRGHCSLEGWWTSIPYFQASTEDGKSWCVPTGWFLRSYTQIALLLPLVTYLLWTIPRRGGTFILTFIILILSTSTVGLKLYKQETVKQEGLSSYGGFLNYLFLKYQSLGYLCTLGRLGNVVVGCLVGYLLKVYEQQEIDSWPNWFKSKWTLVGASTFTLIIVILPIFGDGSTMITLEQLVFGHVLLNSAWPVLISIIVVHLCTIHNQALVAKFFGHTFFHILNKLALTIFLIHWEIINVIMTTHEQAPSYGFFEDNIKYWSLASTLSILMASIIHVLIEVPLSKVIKIYLKL